MRGRVLIVAGSDSSGGAGIQADIKTVAALGGFAATAITALTAQNTLGVHGLDLPEVSLVAVLDADKEGFLRSKSSLMQVAGRAARNTNGKVILFGDKITDVLLDRDGFHLFEIERVKTRHTHGTGCTLASAISTGLSQGLTLPAAVGQAQKYVVEAIRSAPGLGAGHGPLNHAHMVT